MEFIHIQHHCINIFVLHVNAELYSMDRVMDNFTTIQINASLYDVIVVMTL